MTSIQVALAALVVLGMPALFTPVLATPAPPGAGGSVVQAEWPQFDRTAAHANNAPAETAFTPATITHLAVRWRGRYGMNDESQGGAAVDHGVAYIGGTDGKLRAFSLSACAAGDCQPLWHGVTGNGIYSTPVVSGDEVLIGSADHFLYAFPAAGCGQSVCAPRWRGRLHDAVLYASVAVADGVAYLGDYGGRLYAFPTAGCGHPVCDPTWTAVAGPNERLTSSPAVGRGTVYIGTFLDTPDDVSGRLLAFAAAGCGAAVCAPEWAADLRGPSDTTLAPLISGSIVYAGSGTRFSNDPDGGIHLFAFAADGCGAPTCRPLRSYDTGDGGITGGLTLGDGVLYATTQDSPDPNTIGVVAAFPAGGCGQPLCPRLWTGVNFGSGFESPPVLVGGLVLVAKGPASGFPVDEAVLSYPAGGCGAATCRASSFTRVGRQQFYLGAPMAVAEHTIIVPTGASNSGVTTLVALQVLTS